MRGAESDQRGNPDVDTIEYVRRLADIVRNECLEKLKQIISKMTMQERGKISFEKIVEVMTLAEARDFWQQGQDQKLSQDDLQKHIYKQLDLRPAVIEQVALLGCGSVLERVDGRLKLVGGDVFACLNDGADKYRKIIFKDEKVVDIEEVVWPNNTVRQSVCENMNREIALLKGLSGGKSLQVILAEWDVQKGAGQPAQDEYKAQ